MPVFMGYAVTFTEFFGGILLIIRLLSPLAALGLTINLVATTLLVNVDVGLIAPPDSGAGAGNSTWRSSLDFSWSSWRVWETVSLDYVLAIEGE